MEIPKGQGLRDALAKCTGCDIELGSGNENPLHDEFPGGGGGLFFLRGGFRAGVIAFDVLHQFAQVIPLKGSLQGDGGLLDEDLIDDDRVGEKGVPVHTDGDGADLDGVGFPESLGIADHKSVQTSAAR